MKTIHILLIKYSMTAYLEIPKNLPYVVRMPYQIRKCPHQNAYKVYAPHGALSKRCLPLETAKKQRTAVILSEIGLSQRPPSGERTLPLGSQKAKRFI